MGGSNIMAIIEMMVSLVNLSLIYFLFSLTTLHFFMTIFLYNTRYTRIYTQVVDHYMDKDQSYVNIILIGVKVKTMAYVRKVKILKHLLYQ